MNFIQNMLSVAGDFIRYIMQSAAVMFAVVIAYGLTAIVFDAAFKVKLPNPFKDDIIWRLWDYIVF